VTAPSGSAAFHRLRAVSPRPPFTLHLVFADGAHRLVDLETYILATDRPAVAALREWAAFSQARAGEDGMTVVWPSGWDLDASVLYGRGTPCTCRSET
jgi:hypothetical protein